MRRRKANKRRYRDAFYNKQQLRLFHGKIKEQAFRKFFRRHLIHTVNRNQSFFAALERRVDIFFFRMRLLPTIFACHQYIHHHGILINRRVEHSPNALLSTGDIVSIQRQH
jgi:ribosomal protein S4